MNTNRGMITVMQVLGLGVGVATFLGGIFWAKVSETDSAIAKVREESVAANVETVQRVARLEEAIITVKTDTSEIKADIRELLKRQK